MTANTCKRFLAILLSLLIVSCAAPQAATPATEPAASVPEVAEEEPDQAPEPGESGLLNPGDMIGEMEITTAAEWDWDNNLYSLCIEGNAENEAIWEDDSLSYAEYPCNLYAGTSLIFNCMGQGGEPGDSVEDRFARLEGEMILDGRSLNLPAFGSLDYSFGDINILLYNVLVNNMTPGEHRLECSWKFDDEAGGTTWLLTVSEPPKIEAPPDAEEMLFHGDSEMFRTLDDFFTRLETAVEMNELPHFWAAVNILGQSPLIFGDVAVFPYKGEGRNVIWEGLYFSKPYTRIGNSDIWLMMQEFEPDAVLDYRIVVDGEPQMDPLNPLRVEAFSNTSVLQMPEFAYPAETLYRDDIPHGELTDNLLISSEYLGYDKFYRVYTPPGYESLDSLPVIYVTDGTDAINEVYLAMPNVLDNLIAEGRIAPVIAVFIDPHDAATGEYVRGVELVPNGLGDCPFCDFVTAELVPLIDANYKSDPTADSRALLGTSLGGLWATYMGVAHNDLFHLIGIQSHPTEGPFEWLWEAYETAEDLPIKVFLHHGTYDIGTAPAFAALLEEKGVPVQYIENHGGHAHSSWRTTTDDALEYFFSP